MAQYLTMPFARQMMLCGYKTAKYKDYWGYAHFGVDISTIQGGAGDDPTVYASGEGTVVASGYDSGVGGVVVVIYPDCILHSGEITSLVARYFHMKSESVKAGDKVKRGDFLGIEGKEKTGDYHLHLEFDTDIDYPLLSPQVKGGSIIKAGIDTTINPSLVMHKGAGQVIVKPTYNPKWLNPEDVGIPAMPEEEAAVEDELDVLRKEVDQLNLKCRMQAEECGRLMDKIEQIKAIIG